MPYITVESGTLSDKQKELLHLLHGIRVLQFRQF